MRRRYAIDCIFHKHASTLICQTIFAVPGDSNHCLVINETIDFPSNLNQLLTLRSLAHLDKFMDRRTSRFDKRNGGDGGSRRHECKVPYDPNLSIAGRYERRRNAGQERKKRRYHIRRRLPGSTTKPMEAK